MTKASEVESRIKIEANDAAMVAINRDRYTDELDR